MLVGGYALALHGYVRSTGDLDIWIGSGRADLEKAATAIREFGFSEVTTTSFADPHKVVRMGIRPVCIEVMTGISGVEFDECWSRRWTAAIGGIAVPVISMENLKASKRSSGRLRDLADVEELE